MISIAIPCYEMGGVGYDMLDFSISKIHSQSYSNFEIVVTDHSIDDKVEQVCSAWSNRLSMSYHRISEGRGSPTVNTNKGIIYSTGDIIKLLCQDDYLFDNYSLENIVKSFDDEKVMWVASNYVHTNDRSILYNVHEPKFNERVYAVNTIGTPSCIAIRNIKDIPMFDETLIYQYDCDWYKRVYDMIGEPYILKEVTMVNCVWGGSVTNTLATDDIRQKEFNYVRDKYEN